jgi:carbonic anhydrase
MDLFTEVFDNNRKWVAEKTQTDPQYFDKLAAG